MRRVHARESWRGGPAPASAPVSGPADLREDSRNSTSVDPIAGLWLQPYGVLNPRGVASRWTFYIGKDGRIAYIDKTVKPATSAEDMAAKLGELKVAAKK